MRKIAVTGFVLFGLWCLLQGFEYKRNPEDVISLGKKLFHDKILSEDRSISCASCHLPDFSFSDTAVVSTGVHGRKGRRNSPAITNMSSRSSFFWDGRAATLQEQALLPIQDTMEMNLPLPEALRRLNADRDYAASFEAVFGGPATKENLGESIAAFVETLETTSPFDEWINGKEDAMSASAVRGRDIFMVKAKCFECHFGPDFTGDEFRSIGLYNGKAHNDRGRFDITRDSLKLGTFKVPGLRNIALTAPYMHDGSMKTLRQVIDYYDDPMKHMPDGINRDSVLRSPLGLSEQEKTDLEAFLHALTDPAYKNSRR